MTTGGEMRRALGLKPGSKVRFKRQGRKFSLEPVDAVALADAGVAGLTLHTVDRRLAKLAEAALAE